MDQLQPDLAVDFCGLRLRHPLVLASGGLGESADSLAPFQRTAAAVVTRTIRLQVDADRRVFPSPHLALGPRKAWLLNCEWGNLRPWEYWLREGLPQLRERQERGEGGAVIVSLSGRDIGGCAALARQLAGAGVQLLEINVSCSHAGHLYGRISEDREHVARLVASLKAATSIPVMVKLGASPVVAEIASVAVAAGADALSTTNSIGPGLDLDLGSGRPRLGIAGGMGGLTGRAIFPLALQAVHEIVEATGVPVMGIGGVSSYREVAKMLLVGATCVQLYTEAFFQGPALFERIVADLRDWLAEQGHTSVAGLRGASRAWLQQPSNLAALVPEVLPDRCRPCGCCQRVCTVDAITVGAVAQLDASVCIGCGACVDACPPGLSAIALPDQPAGAG